MKDTGVTGGTSSARRRSQRELAVSGRSGSGSKPHRITPAEELSDELLHIFHNPVQGCWSNRWVIDLADERAPDGEQSPRTP